MKAEELKTIDTSKYKITETGQVLKMTKEEMKMYFMQDGQPVEIKRSSELNIKLSKKEKEHLRQMRKHRSGTLTLEPTDLYKDFKEKIKAQIRQRGTK